MTRAGTGSPQWALLLPPACQPQHLTPGAGAFRSCWGWRAETAAHDECELILETIKDESKDLARAKAICEEPETTRAMGVAFEMACVALQLRDRSDPATTAQSML